MSQQLAWKTAARHSKKKLIYLVDDEALLLDLAELTLVPEGYTVRKFKDPVVALKTFLRARPKPSLLISDYAMGSMNGVELIAQCKTAVPSLKCILVSGTATAHTVQNAPVPVDRFINKPYHPSDLTELVRGLLSDTARF